MARITIEDCLKNVENRFELVHVAIKRVKELKKGAPPLVECDNKEVVTALREIAAGKVYPIRPGQELPQPEVEVLPEIEKLLPEEAELKEKEGDAND